MHRPFQTRPKAATVPQIDRTGLLAGLFAGLFAGASIAAVAGTLLVAVPTTVGDVQLHGHEPLAYSPNETV